MTEIAKHRRTGIPLHEVWQEKHYGLEAKILANKSTGRRERKYSPDNGQFVGLFNPDTNKMESWPKTGLMLKTPLGKETNTPKHLCICTKTVTRWLEYGFITVTGEKWAHYPSGTPHNPFGGNTPGGHTKRHCDTITIHTVDGDVVYKVTHQPGRYLAESQVLMTMKDFMAETPARVDDFYLADLQSRP